MQESSLTATLLKASSMPCSVCWWYSEYRRFRGKQLPFASKQLNVGRVRIIICLDPQGLGGRTALEISTWTENQASEPWGALRAPRISRHVHCVQCSMRPGIDFLVAQWYPFTFLWSGFPVENGQEQKGYPGFHQFTGPPT